MCMCVCKLADLFSQEYMCTPVSERYQLLKTRVQPVKSKKNKKKKPAIVHRSVMCQWC